jgi:hypothetical protein
MSDVAADGASQEVAVGVRAVLESDLADLRDRLERERRAYRRHLLWMMLGASPGALAPMLFLVSEFGGATLVAVVGIVIVTEGWKALQAKRTLRGLETVEMELLDHLEALERGSGSASSETDAKHEDGGQGG